MQRLVEDDSRLPGEVSIVLCPIPSFAQTRLSCHVLDKAFTTNCHNRIKYHVRSSTFNRRKDHVKIKNPTNVQKFMDTGKPGSLAQSITLQLSHMML